MKISFYWLIATSRTRILFLRWASHLLLNMPQMRI